MINFNKLIQAQFEKMCKTGKLFKVALSGKEVGDIYINYFEKDPIEDGMSTKGLCEINILKYRYGETGPFYTKFKGAFSAFENYDMNEGGIAKSNESDDVF